MERKELDGRKFTLEKYEELHAIVVEFVKSTPSAGSSRRRRVASDSDDLEAVFEDFQSEVFEPFAQDMAFAIEESMEGNPIVEAFACLDVNNFPSTEPDLLKFGEDDLEILISWYGGVQQAAYSGDEEQISRADPVIDPGETREEYKSFKKLLKLEQSKFDKGKQKDKELLEKN